MNDQYLKQYIKQVSSNLVLNRRQKKVILSTLQNELRDQLDQNPITTYDQLIDLFGAPEQVAETLSETEDYAKRIAAAKSSKIRTIAIVLIAAICIVTLALICTHIASLQPGYYSTSGAVVE